VTEPSPAPTLTISSFASPPKPAIPSPFVTEPAASFPRVPLPGSLRGLYGYGSGTSFAAPEVAGAAALVMAANPLLGAQDVARILKESASGRGAWTAELGYGVLDVAKAVDIATGAQPQIAPAGLKLVARTVRGRVTLRASLSSPVRGVSTAARAVAFDRYNATRKAWRSLAKVQTRSDGKAVFRLREERTPLKLRARWVGAIDLAPASSKAVTVKALRYR